MPARLLNSRVLATWSATGFVVLSVIVATGVLDSADRDLLDFFRPGDRWGHWQTHADHVVVRLQPLRVAIFLAVVTVVLCGVRRSWRPAAYALAVGGASSALVLGTKTLLHRTGPADTIIHGGSYPSGHTLSVIICLGTALLLLRPSTTRPWHWLLVGGPAGAMGLSLLLVGAHWFTDVIGGGLLGVLILSVAAPYAVLAAPAPSGSAKLDDEAAAHR